MPLQKTNSIDNINHHTFPHNQHPQGFSAAPHHSGSNGLSSPPSAGAIVGPNTGGYFSPAPPPAAYYGPPPSGHDQQQQVMFYNSPPFPPAQHPGMLYSAPVQPPQVFLGFVNTGSTTKPVYGPPGANFNWLGNVYIEHIDGSKDWIGPYRSHEGKIVKNPKQRAEEDCCYTVFGLKGYYDIK